MAVVHNLALIMHSARVDDAISCDDSAPSPAGVSTRAAAMEHNPLAANAVNRTADLQTDVTFTAILEPKAHSGCAAVPAGNLRHATPGVSVPCRIIHFTRR
ncbi:hypothetical protein KIP88_40940 [Bradyrhizobium sp. SRL28]|uniref:hypothetical protein n=1 Tax=Bradyrhizobium sp. SRL28 TaxID=2836178 RepID=UPI001BDE7E2D|nr:hypothetical protein [Bradyrhizobium sp. SRL28]MBT1516774.1 hypothetical protein [Bradyrhizobium sp. SRL28]